MGIIKKNQTLKNNSILQPNIIKQTQCYKGKLQCKATVHWKNYFFQFVQHFTSCTTFYYH